MPPIRAKFRPLGFTLLELLVVIAIMAILMAIIFPVYGAVMRKKGAVYTKALMHNVLLSLESYHNDWGVYPVNPLAPSVNGIPPGTLVDSGNGNNPGYFQTPCAACGSTVSGTEDNSALIKLLLDHNYLNLDKSSLKNGSAGAYNLVDYYGNPIIIRFLLTLPTSTNGAAVSGQKLTEHVYMWSYGYNRMNDIPATAPNYTNAGLPNYDLQEVNNMNSGPGGDDPNTWR